MESGGWCAPEDRLDPSDLLHVFLSTLCVVKPIPRWHSDTWLQGLRSTCKCVSKSGMLVKISFKTLPVLEICTNDDVSADDQKCLDFLSFLKGMSILDAFHWRTSYSWVFVQWRLFLFTVLFNTAECAINDRKFKRHGLWFVSAQTRKIILALYQ